MTNRKAEIKEIWLDQIKTAKHFADKAIIGNPDNGTCNFDACLIKKEDKFTYAETIAMFAECGITISKHSQGWFEVNELKGQAEKNTLWHTTFKEWLEEQGFTCSMYYRID